MNAPYSFAKGDSSDYPHDCRRFAFISFGNPPEVRDDKEGYLSDIPMVGYWNTGHGGVIIFGKARGGS